MFKVAQITKNMMEKPQIKNHFCPLTPLNTKPPTLKTKISEVYIKHQEPPHYVQCLSYVLVN